MVQGSTAVQAPLQLAGQEWLVTCVSMGNPHAVVFGTKQGNLKVPLPLQTTSGAAPCMLTLIVYSHRA